MQAPFACSADSWLEVVSSCRIIYGLMERVAKDRWAYVIERYG
jgi:hypothetical protein